VNAPPRLAVAAVAVVLPLCGCREAPPAESASLTVFAAASLSEVMQQLSDASVAAGGPALTINAAGTQALVAQLRAGVTADLFCSANRQYGDLMATEGRTGPAVTLARNHLALAATPLNEQVKAFEDLTGPGVKIVRCAAAVPAGDYTDRALAALAEAGQAAAATAIQARVVSLEADVHGVVAKLTTGAADAGFCYRTDLVAAGLREVELPAEMRLGTECTVAVVAHSPRADAAQAFIDRLTEPAFQQLLAAAGFAVPSAP